jgi:transcriptional regulator with XRE-family HTH domain
MTQAHNRKRTPIRIAFGKIVREKRLELGLSQEKLAEKADLHTNYVGSVERGERNIALENIYALAEALECSPKDLLLDKASFEFIKKSHRNT